MIQNKTAFLFLLIFKLCNLNAAQARETEKECNISMLAEKPQDINRDYENHFHNYPIDWYIDVKCLEKNSYVSQLYFRITFCLSLKKGVAFISQKLPIKALDQLAEIAGMGKNLKGIFASLNAVYYKIENSDDQWQVLNIESDNQAAEKINSEKKDE